MNYYEEYDAEEWQKKYDAYIKSATWKGIRKTLFQLRGAKCEKCGFGSYRLHIHHLTYERLCHEFLSDLQILCPQCHDAVHVVLQEIQARKPSRLQLGFEGWLRNTGKDDNEHNFDEFCRWIGYER